MYSIGPSKIGSCIVLMGNAQPFEPHLVADLHLSGNFPLKVHVRRSRISVESASDDFNSATNELGQALISPGLNEKKPERLLI